MRQERGSRAVRREDRGPRATERRATERRQESPPRAAGNRDQGPDRSKSAERTRTETRAQRNEEIRSARSKLSSQQRERLHSGFDLRRAHVANVKFAKRIGAHIPRRVRLFAIPAAVIALVPAYTYYRYVVLDDEVCIVDPDTYEIVDVIDEGPYPAASRPQVAELHLSPAEQRIVLDSIAPDFPPAEVRIRLALGAEIPRSVELHLFPNVVLDRIPKLQDFRFVVVEHDVVIVDPGDRAVALVIER